MHQPPSDGLSPSLEHIAAVGTDVRYPCDVWPRHLAGPGDARHLTHPLAASGWTRTSDPLAPGLVLLSPDQQTSVSINPQSPDRSYWCFIGRDGTPEEWWAEFGQGTPVEILAGLADALIAPTPEPAPTVPDVLRRHGWTWAGDDDCLISASPDGLATVTRDGKADVRAVEPWHIKVRAATNRTLWHGWLDSTTPAHLVAALAESLASPTPVVRSTANMLAPGAQQARSSMTSAQLADAHLQRVEAAARSGPTAPSPTPASALPPPPVPGQRRTR
ncbi:MULTISPECIES: DUF317 domain-containing protein [Streptomyces]|uniref:DUF317 domain-containing protein n=1 Tax=Streptomyces ramulosus TaxID=47762 RepID=A0ABW1FTD5_9ACTN